MENSRKFYIDGQWVDPVNANDFDVIDPRPRKPSR